MVTGANHVRSPIKNMKPNNTMPNLLELCQNIPGVVYQFLVTKDDERKFIYLSPAVEAVYEVSAQEALESHEALISCVFPEDRTSHAQSIEHAIRTKTPWAHVHRIRTPKNKVKWIHAQATPATQEDGSTLWHGILSDITWYMQKESELFVLMQRFEMSLSRHMQLLSSDAAWLESVRRQVLSQMPIDPSVVAAEQHKRGRDDPPQPGQTSGLLRARADEANRLPSVKLTKREEDILRMISRGMTSKEIARRFDIATATVSAHRRSIRKKLKMKTSAAVARYALLRFPSAPGDDRLDHND